MTKLQLLMINFGILVFLMIYFVFFRSKPQQPTLLKLRKNDSQNNSNNHLKNPFETPFVGQTAAVQQVTNPAPVAAPKEALQVAQDLQQSAATLAASSSSVHSTITSTTSTLITQTQPVTSTQTTSEVMIQSVAGHKKNSRPIYFVYNGHEWECHEVLGLSRECTLQEATAMYQDLIKTSDPSTFEFYESAYNGILKKKVD